MIQGYFNKFHPNVLHLYLHNWDYKIFMFQLLKKSIKY